MNVKGKKGSISIFVLVGLLFMSSFLLLSYANSVSKSKIAKEQFNMISSIYSHNDGDAKAYERAYTALRKQNVQILTATSESDTMELTKTYEGSLSNYIIYGNSVQNGTPTPSDPVEIQSVGDKTKNLFSGFEKGTGLNATTGIESTSVNYATTDYIKVDFSENSSYYLSGLTRTLNSWVGAYNANKEFLGRTEGTARNSMQLTSNSFTSGTAQGTGDIAYIRVTQLKTANSTGTIDDVDGLETQLEEGSTATKYEPYGYKIPVKVSGKVGKNLLPSDVFNTSAYVSDYGMTHPTVYKLPFIEANKTYTISLDYSNDSESYYYFYKRKDNTNTRLVYLITNNTTSGKQTYTFTAEEDTEYFFYGNNTRYLESFIDNASNFQIEEGSVATRYEPCVEPITTNIYLDEPLRKVGDCVDYIDFKTQQVVRVIEELVFTGAYTETWNKSSSVDNRYLTYVTKAYKTNVTTPKILCDRLIYNGQRTVGTIDLSYTSGNPSGTQLVLGMSFETLEACTQYISNQYNAGTPMHVIYPLYKEDNPETIEIPELELFEDYTKIEILTETQPSKIEATYEGYTLE